MSRPNRCIKDEQGNDVWVVRSTVVIPIVFKYDEKTGDVFTLLEKRGPAVTHCGEWCCPCGYIDWDETLKEACVREVREETGLVLDEGYISLFDVDTNKNSRNQTIDHWFICYVKNNPDVDINNVETKDEILELKWLKVANVYEKTSWFKSKRFVTIYKSNIEAGYGKWAFKYHPTNIIKMLEKIFVTFEKKYYEV